MPHQTADHALLDIITNCLTLGERVTTRNADCFRVFCTPVVFQSTPLVRVRRTAWKNALREWEWFMSGSNWIQDLHPSVQEWWKPWADDKGVVKYNYSQQFRSFFGKPSGGLAGGYVDQVSYLLDSIRAHPYSRRACATTWNTFEMTRADCKITNCHGSYIQAFVTLDDRLFLKMYQRSADVVCGVPHNWIQYWAFLMWLAHNTGRRVGGLLWEGGDVHVYSEHCELAGEMLGTYPPKEPVPQLIYKPKDNPLVFRADDFDLDRPYEPVLKKNAVMVV